MSENTKAVAVAPGTGLAPIAELERAADAMAKSGFFGIKTREEGVALMLLAQANNEHFTSAVRDYHIISGRPAMKADAMLARFQKAGGSVKWITLTDSKVEAKFSHPQGGEVTITWDDERVAQAELKNPMHKKYPRQMKRARAISEGIRTVFPGAITGQYTVEEVQDMAYEEKVVAEGAVVAAASVDPPKPIGKAEGEQGTGMTDEEILEHEAAIKEAPDADKLRGAFSSAWKHAGEVKDETSRVFFKHLYDERKAKEGW
jgi:hypothetical protein